MLLPTVTKLLPLASLAVTITAAPAPALAIDNAAVRNCESDYVRCLRLRMSLDYCHETVCNMYNNECKPCQEGALPTIYDRAVTHSTDDSTACEVLILNSRAGAKPQRITASSSARTPTALSSAQILATHLLDRLTRPRQLLILTLQTSWTSPTRSLTRSASLKDGMIIVMTKIDADGKLEGNCTWVCSGKVSCQLHCCDSTTEAQCSLIEDGGVLPEGQATEAAGKCEIIKKNKVAEIMVCHIPEAAGDALTAGWGQDPMGVHCQIFWTGTMSQLICNYVG